jgi:putative endopeptidase
MPFHRKPIRIPRALAVAAGLVLLPAALAAQARERAIDPANLDRACKPCADFYRFANGGWLDRNPIPPERPEWSSYDEVGERTRADLRAILEEAARHAAAGTGSADTRTLGVFYATCMDSARAEREGASPIRAELARVDAMASRAALQDVITRLQSRDVDAPFSFAAERDPRDGSRMIGGVWQSGTTLPDRDDYLSEDSSSRAMRERLRAYAAEVLVLAGRTAEDARADAGHVLAIETELARASLTPLEMRDPANVYHKMSAAEVQALMPHWEWPRYLAATGTPADAAINVSSLDYARAVDRLLAERPLEAWRAYLRYRVVNDAASYLSSPFADAAFRFRSALSGTQRQRPRWERCMGSADAYVRDPLGRAYMERVFTPAVRARGEAIVANLRAVMRERLTRLEWMGEATRAEALAKLDALRAEIGGPTRWRDYAGVSLAADVPFVENVARVSEWWWRANRAEIGGPSEPDRWALPPHRVSGAMELRRNRLIYPAAKFQPPFFHPDADDAVNYGAIGATIGHEIGHAFDDQGRRYDARGNVRDWWTPEDDARFRRRAQLLADQFDQYVAVDTFHVNGKLTLGENLADLGGLTLAYYALQRSLEGKPRETIDGFTPEQRFFLSWAQNWRANERPEMVRTQVKTDPHAPSRLRVIGPLSNMPEFARAFACRPGDPMVRPDSLRVQVW